MIATFHNSEQKFTKFVNLWNSGNSCRKFSNSREFPFPEPWFMCQKFWKLVGSRQTYCNNNIAYFFWTTLYTTCPRKKQATFNFRHVMWPCDVTGVTSQVHNIQNASSIVLVGIRWSFLVWHDITKSSHDMTWHDMTSHDVMSWQDITSWHHVTSHDMTSHDVTWRHVMSASEPVAYRLVNLC